MKVSMRLCDVTIMAAILSLKACTKLRSDSLDNLHPSKPVLCKIALAMLSIFVSEVAKWVILA